MINNLQISSINTHLSEDLRLYIQKKLGNMDRYVPKKARDSLRTEIKLKELKTKNKQNFMCEVIMRLPKEVVTIHENSASFISAVDQSESRLKIRLKKYKEMHSGPRFHRKVINRALNK